MAIIKIEALKYLAAELATLVPELEGHICVGAALPNHDLALPSLAIVPAGGWRWSADQEDEVGSLGPDRAVVRVGVHEVTLQLQLSAATPEERYVLEQAIEQAFFATEGHAGIIFGDVKACEDDFGVFQASFMLDETTWRDGKAFTNQLWSYLEVHGSIPALATRAGAYAMNEIRLGLTEVFDTTVTIATFTTDTDIERVRVNADGTITAL